MLVNPVQHLIPSQENLFFFYPIRFVCRERDRGDRGGRVSYRCESNSDLAIVGQSLSRSWLSALEDGLKKKLKIPWEIQFPQIVIVIEILIDPLLFVLYM